MQAVLNRHGITRVLAAEGGRTSRGSISNMREYVAFLNGQAASGNVSRNTWITEAVTERLARLASSSRHQGAGGANG